MKDPRPNVMMITAFVLALAALLAGPAQARVIDTDGSTTGTEQQPYDGGLRAVQTPTVIPYLSHGLHLKSADGAAATAAKNPTVIPYLSHGMGVQSDDGANVVSAKKVVPYMSHGIGVDESQFSGLRGDDTVNRGWYTGLEYKDMPPVTTDSGDGFGWRDGGITAGGAALLLALASAAFLASRQRTRVAMP